MSHGASMAVTDDGFAALGEADDADGAGDEAVDGERGQRAGLEVVGEPPDGGVGRQSGDGRAEEDLAVDVGAGGAGPRRGLEQAGGQDDGGGEQEREASGVAVRQATGQAADHGDARAADPGEQGERLEETNDGGFAVVQGRQAARRRGRLLDRRAGRAGGGPVGLWGFGVVGISRGSAAQRLAGQQDQPVNREEDGRREWFGEQGAESVFEGQPGDPDGDGGDDQQPGEAFVGVGGDDAARGDGGPNGASESADDAHPVGSEEDDQGQGGGHVQGDDDSQVRAGFAGRGGRLGDQGFPAATDESRHQHGVSQAGDREQFSDTL